MGLPAHAQLSCDCCVELLPDLGDLLCVEAGSLPVAPLRLRDRDAVKLSLPDRLSLELSE